MVKGGFSVRLDKKDKIDKKAGVVQAKLTRLRVKVLANPLCFALFL
jgi:hypothetical protein